MNNEKTPVGLKHSFEVHSQCEIHNCMICDGGICHCLTCGGAEIDLSTDCVGRRLTEKERIGIANGDDYKNGKWSHVT
jgi:hypothetical protein